MIRFAELDNENKVINVLIASESYISSLPGIFVNGQQVDNFEAVIGSTYDSSTGKFIKEKPYPSWILDENGEWNPPVPRPQGVLSMWNEESGSWTELESVEIDL